jgi:ABC-type uncharacterized transport system ATPase subunit
MTLLKMEEITKVFPGVRANDGISFDLQVGEIHALVGENGAGKTTLMKILYGLYKPDSGHIYLKDRPIAIPETRSTRESAWCTSTSCWYRFSRFWRTSS